MTKEEKKAEKIRRAENLGRAAAEKDILEIEDEQRSLRSKVEQRAYFNAWEAAHDSLYLIDVD